MPLLDYLRGFAPKAQSAFVRRAYTRELVGELSFTGAGRSFGSFSDSQDELDRVRPGQTTLSRYNEYDIERPLAILGVERNVLRGLVRTLAGVAINHTTIRDYTGDTVDAVDDDGETVDATMATTRLAEQCAADAMVGCEGGTEAYLRLAVSFDTRDFEPDPNNGVYADLAVDLAPGLLTEYRFARFLAAAQVGTQHQCGNKADV